MLDTDRKEEAKATSEQEIQAAEDYIARDLQQAIYIYDNDGLSNTSGQGVNSGIENQIPPVVSTSISPSITTSDICNNTTTCVPILVFWKREYVPNSVCVDTCNSGTSSDGGFAYALVAYYYITNPTTTTGVWSSEARIGRYELRGPVNNTNDTTDYTAQGLSCTSGYNPPPINDSTINGSNLKQIMDQWTNASNNNTGQTPPSCATSSPTSSASSTTVQTFTPTINILVDYISTTGPGSTGNTENPITCPYNSSGTQLQGIGNSTTGFYACVDATNVFAQVYIRGNALARLQSTNIAYSNNTSTYFPNENVQTQGHGYLYVQ